MQPQSTKQGRLILYCSGGLGNQMFEYAAGRFFARRLGKALEVVKPPVSKQRWREYKRPFQLDAFRIEETPREMRTQDRVFFSGNPRVRQWHGLIGGVVDSEVLQEPAIYRFHADLAADPHKKNTYLNGCWQAAAYVEAVQAELRAEYRLRAPMQERSRAYAEQIHGLECPVSVHVRIGDYAVIHHATGKDGNERVSNVLPPVYYERAFEAVRQVCGDPTLVVFSDEPEGARRLLHGAGRCVFIEGNDVFSAHEDMWLMSLCRHHVIANSSFSWWGAWLNESLEKQVFAPRCWGNTEDSHFPDLYPRGWHIVDNLP